MTVAVVLKSPETLSPFGEVPANIVYSATLGRPPQAAIETIWRQTESLIELLNPEGGPMSMVNLLQDPIRAGG